MIPPLTLVIESCLPPGNGVVMFKARTSRALCLLLILGFAPLALTGCIGSFAAWHKVKEFNEDASDSQWFQELLFIVLNIIPVYGVAYALDILILNSVEFWTGENPMMTSRTITGEDGSVTTITPVDGDRLEVTVVAPDRSEHTFLLERGDQMVSAYDADSQLLVRAQKNGSNTEIIRGE